MLTQDQTRAERVASSASAASVDRPLAVFDLDGTLVRRDTFLPFLISYGRRHRRWRSLLSMPIPVAAYAIRIMRDFSAKQRLLVSFLGGQPQDRIAEHAEWFAEHWVERHPQTAGIAELRRHQERGHRVILLSASPSVYVPVVARRLEIDEVVCTPVEFRDGTCLGRLCGPNCKGEAKLRMLQEYLQREAAPPESHAYGDSKHDLPVLHWAERGLLVRRNAVELVEQTT